MDQPKKFSGPESYPEYPFNHCGSVLVLGNAFTLKDDYDRAREIYPNAPVIAVNGASEFTKAFAIFTQHAAKLPKWIRMQERFGNDFLVHAAGTQRDKTQFGDLKDHKPWVDHWWKYGAGGGTSTWGARRVATYMGFDEVILCGMPLEKGTYSNGRMAQAFMRDDPINHYREQILLDVDFHDNVKSMSGWTREVFGEPN